MLPSKMRPTISPLRLTTGDPELPPMMSFVDDEVHRRRQVERRTPIDVAARQLERRLVVEGVRPVVQAEHRRLWRRDGAVHRVALDLPVRQPQRERRVGVGGMAVDGEPRAADLLAGLRLDARHLIVERLLVLARERIGGAREHDERIGRGGNPAGPAAASALRAAGSASLVPPIASFATRVAACGPSARPGMNGSDGPSSSSDCCSAVGQQHFVERRIDRRGREQLQLEPLQLRVVEAVRAVRRPASAFSSM